MLRIDSVEPGSYAADLGLDTGDFLLSINQQPIEDLVDYYRSVEVEHLNLEVLRQNDEVWELELEKGSEEDLGLVLEHPQPQQCGNNCVFCFVHQLPQGMRRTLYIKDEDYRFSYLYGSYITLSNLHESDLQRILDQRLSPLYISVHATDEKLRQQMLGSVTPPILPLIRRLTDGGIQLHCQIVVCPGYNDGEVLENTIADLAAFYPNVASLAVVPVGLTRHREKLPKLRNLTVTDAQQVLYQIEQRQEEYREKIGSRFVFAADELYLQAQSQIPDLSAYEELAQLENGVGLIAQFRQQADEVLLEADPLELEKISLVTGYSFSSELQDFVERLAVRTGVELKVMPVANEFFGAAVTVTGLLTGADLVAQLANRKLGQGLLLPDVMLKESEQILLDDLTVEQLGEKLGVPVIVVDSSPWGILDGLEQLSAGPVSIVHC
jgi:putative radical SAM enzyme (TIGR03279 family)